MTLRPASSLQAAESPELTGRVVVGSGDARPPIEVEVALHRITGREGGIVARGATDPEGRFRFTLPNGEPEEFAVYLITARYRDILYFGPPLHGPPGAGSDYLVRVHETRASDSLLAIGRTLTVREGAGGIQVVDVLELSNPSDSTLVPAGPEAPGWTVRLPEGAADVTVAGTAAAPRPRGGVVRVETPVPPGGRDVAVRYRLPGEGVRLWFDRALPALEVRVHESLRAEPGPGLRASGPVRTADATYARFTATDLPEGAAVELRLRAPATPPWGWILTAAGVALAAAAFLSARPASPRLRRTPRSS